MLVLMFLAVLLFLLMLFLLVLLLLLLLVLLLLVFFSLLPFLFPSSPRLVLITLYKMRRKCWFLIFVHLGFLSELSSDDEDEMLSLFLLLETGPPPPPFQISPLIYSPQLAKVYSK